MYKKTNPQKKLFGVDTQLSTGLRARLKTTWAHLFNPSSAVCSKNRQKTPDDVQKAQ
jgi:hypothetical protein